MSTAQCLLGQISLCCGYVMLKVIKSQEFLNFVSEKLVGVQV